MNGGSSSRVCAVAFLEILTDELGSVEGRRRDSLCILIQVHLGIPWHM